MAGNDMHAPTAGLTGAGKISPSAVEQKALSDGPHEFICSPEERIPAVTVETFPALGRLAALRFLEWVQGNPEGVVSLPTGKTPEHFIAWVKRLLGTWDEPEPQSLLGDWGLDPSRRPDMKGLRFVQIDEFYPSNPSHENSFIYYVKRFYIGEFGLDPDRAMLIDCSRVGLAAGETLFSVWPDGEVDLGLRFRAAHTPLERKQKRVIARVDQWCQDYESRIREMGGIGFFLGGIGFDGHVAFNVRGSDHHSTTRLTFTNYETQAAAAMDLGGIETARKRLVVTIGLGTIAFNPDAVAIIMAAGVSKAKVVADAIQSAPDVEYPATALARLPNARFYITRSAALGLGERRWAEITRADTPTDEDVERAVIDLAVRKGKRLIDLVEADFASDRFANEVVARRPEDARTLAGRVRDEIARRIERMLNTLEDTRFLHTEPHHDDLILGCLPAIVRHVRRASNTHHFATLTSGFTAVTNDYLRRRLGRLASFLDDAEFKRFADDGYFEPGNLQARSRDLWQYLDGVAAMDQHARDEGAARRLASDLVTLTGERDFAGLRGEIDRLVSYLDSAYPGKKDPVDVQVLKGHCREWEAECLWGYFGWNPEYVHHLRLGFYTGDIFTEEPTETRDVPPITDLLKEVRPDVITLAFDPEANGPDTHYKVMQALNAAIERYRAETGSPPLRVWGYRNVWCRFHPAEANIYVPVSLNMFSVMQSAFDNTFISQRDASFPSWEHDGPFSELAQEIQVEQYQMVKTCLGREWFHEHPSPRIRATRGLVFLREMDFDEFADHSRRLRRAAEDR